MVMPRFQVIFGSMFLSLSVLPLALLVLGITSPFGGIQGQAKQGQKRRRHLFDYNSVSFRPIDVSSRNYESGSI